MYVLFDDSTANRILFFVHQRNMAFSDLHLMKQKSILISLHLEPQPTPLFLHYLTLVKY